MRTSPLLLLLGCLGSACAGGPGGAADEAADPAGGGGAIRVAICQTLCIDDDREGNLRRIAYAVEEAAAQGAQLACFPETAVLGWVNPAAHELADPVPGPTSDRLAALAREHRILLVVGLAEKDGDRLYDSALLIGADGAILAKHRKVNVLEELMDPPYTCGAAGAATVADTPLGRIGLLICADVFQEELPAALAAAAPDLVVVPFGWAADRGAWPGHADSLHAWISRTARVTGAPVIGPNLVGAISNGPWTGMTYGGRSAAADAAGTILGELRDRDAEVRVFSIKLDR